MVSAVPEFKHYPNSNNNWPWTRPLQLVNHMVQKCPAGEDEMHWDARQTKEVTIIFSDVSSLSCPCAFPCSSAHLWFCTMWMTCQGPIFFRGHMPFGVTKINIVLTDYFENYIFIYYWNMARKGKQDGCPIMYICYLSIYYNWRRHTKTLLIQVINLYLMYTHQQEQQQLNSFHLKWKSSSQICKLQHELF